jgi:predicted DCC family thiol-disulfide oxidoreductase YuxK
MPTEAPSTVYYNSACPVCKAGIAMQQGQMAQCNIEWVDVHAHPERAQELGAGLECIRERLHVRMGNGQLAVGAAAVSALLLQMPGWWWLGRCGQWPLIRSVAAFGYNRFAKLLYRWNRRHGHW